MIHDSHPFATPDDERDPVRRFRGRLSAPVTVVTAGSGERRTGLTVSSLMVADGEPGRVFFLCGHNTDLSDRVVETGGFVVHVLGWDDRHLADRFSGRMPSPGGLFVGIETSDGPRGPLIAGLPTRAECRLASATDVGWYLSIDGEVESVALGDPVAPLQYHRGRFPTPPERS